MCKQASKLVLLALLIAGPVRAWDSFASSGYAAGGAAYLSMPAHAYGAALSSAVTAWRTGLAGLQYNPAVLDNAVDFSLYGSYAFLSDDRQFQAVDAIAPVGSWFVAGVSFVNAGVGKIERRDEVGMVDAADSLFSDGENMLAVSAAGRLLGNIAIGVRGRYLHQRLDDAVAGGMGFDAGATWEPDSHLCVGVSVLNVASRLWWNTHHVDEVLPQGRFGVAGLFLKRQLIAELDIVKTWRQPEEVALGIQYTAFDILSVRGGAISSVDTRTWDRRDPAYSFGVGLRYSFFGFDYAITIPTGETDLLSHKVSLYLQFSKSLFE